MKIVVSRKNSQPTAENSIISDQSIVRQDYSVLTSRIVLSDIVKRSTGTRQSPSKCWKALPHFIAVIADKSLPFSIATKKENEKSWLSAVTIELSSLAINKTWVLVSRENTTNVLFNKKGFWSKWNTRSKRPAENQTQSSSRYMCISAIPWRWLRRNVFACNQDFIFENHVGDCCLRRYWFHQMGVKTAFSNGDMSENKYIKRPEESVNSEEPMHVRKPQAALNGLEQEHYSRLQILTLSSVKSLSFKVAHMTGASLFLVKRYNEVSISLCWWTFNSRKVKIICFTKPQLFVDTFWNRGA